MNSYIANIWFNRDSPENIEYKFMAKIKGYQRLHKQILMNKMNKLFTTNYCYLDGNVLNNF